MRSLTWNSHQCDNKVIFWPSLINTGLLINTKPKISYVSGKGSDAYEWQIQMSRLSGCNKFCFVLWCFHIQVTGCNIQNLFNDAFKLSLSKHIWHLMGNTCIYTAFLYQEPMNNFALSFVIFLHYNETSHQERISVGPADSNLLLFPSVTTCSQSL